MLINLQKATIFNINLIGGHSSVVERLVANEKVEGSTPFARSNYGGFFFLMTDLTEKKCMPCEGGVLPFDISEIHKYQKKVDGWDILKGDEEIFFLFKKFKFENFLKSQDFVNKVGKISEEEGHHPDISFGWGYAEIKVTTHAIKGLSENDFILAAKIDQITNA